MLRSLITASAIVIAGATLATAGTKWQANVVPTTAAAPTLSNKSKASMDDKGKVQVNLQDVTDAVGLVNGDGSFTAKTAPALSGDEYVAIVTGKFLALGVTFEFALPIELKKGKGSAKIDASSLFNLIPPGLLKSIEVQGAKVYGPLGAANVVACTALLNSAIPRVNLPPAPNPCQAGALIGTTGIQLP